VSTQAGDVELKIPKLRQGSFFPVILERRRRIDQTLYAVVMEAWVNGVSTRAVDDLVAALGIGTGISKSEVSRICAGLDEQVGEFRGRPLHHTTFGVCVPRRDLPPRPPPRHRWGEQGRAGHLDGGLNRASSRPG